MCLTPSFVPGGLSHVPVGRGTSPARRMTCVQRAVLPSVPVRMRAPASPNEPDAAVAAAAAEIPSPRAVAKSSGEDVKLMSVMRQMEFWFSPANLRRDWYLRRQMDDEGWMDPSLFLKFNRMKVLNVSLPDVIEACRVSTTLEVSSPSTGSASFGDDLGQTRIRRNMNLPTIFSDAGSDDERSIVVQNLPENCSNDLLQDLFSPFGEVCYTWIAKNREDAYAIVSFKEIGMVVDTLENFADSSPESTANMIIQPKSTWDAYVAQGRNRSVVVELSGLDRELRWKTLFNELTDSLRNFGVELVYFLYSNGESLCYLTLSDTEAAEIVLSRAWVRENETWSSMNISARVLSGENDLQIYWGKAANQSLLRKKKKRQASGRVIGTIGDSRGYAPPLGVIVRISDVPEELAWQELMKEVGQLGKVIFLSYRQGDSNAFVRYEDATTAKKVVSKLSEVPEGKGWLSGVDVSLLTGDAETEYWASLQAERKRRGSRSSNIR